ncbi:MAG: hypothetical protein K6T75_10660 [Acetobacteraceae bacterium]|nr:hypothetical protein [Acetobacteraceae bacterium]
MPGEAERREALKKLYGFADWGLKSPAPETTFTLNFFLPAAALTEWRLTKSLALETTGERRVRRWMLEPMAGEAHTADTAASTAGRPRCGEALTLTSFECPSRADACEAVLDYIATCATPRFRPGAELNYDFGEMAWGGAGPGGTVLFLRGNMFLVVRRALGRPPVEGLARWVDRLLSVRPGEGEQGGRIPPQLARMEAGSLAADRRAPVTVEAHDPLKRPVWYQFFVRGGELVRARERVLLSPTAAEVGLEVFAFNEDASWVRGRASLKT